MPHSCSFPDGEEELLSLTSGTILKELRAGALVVGIFEEGQIREIFHRIEEGDYEVAERAVKDEQIILKTPEETYLKGGRFSPDEMVNLLQLVFKSAKKRGFKKVLGIGSLSWAARGVPGSEKIFAYEAALNRIAKGNPDLSIVCVYDRRVFEKPVIEEALRVHGWDQKK